MKIHERRKHLTQSERTAIIGMYQTGEKIAVIAAVFRRHDKTIYRICRSADIPIRWYRNEGRIAYTPRAICNAHRPRIVLAQPFPAENLP